MHRWGDELISAAQSVSRGFLQRSRERSSTIHTHTQAHLDRSLSAASLAEAPALSFQPLDRTGAVCHPPSSCDTPPAALACPFPPSDPSAAACCCWLNREELCVAWDTPACAVCLPAASVMNSGTGPWAEESSATPA
eukprot:1161192-Pelagomonas_calceolata.AAC.11